MQIASDAKRAKAFDSLFERYDGPRFGVRLWDGWSWHTPGSDLPQFELAFNNASALEALFVRPSEITLGEAFVAKEIDVTGDFPSAFNLAEHVFHSPEGRRRKILETASRVFLGMSKALVIRLRETARRYLSTMISQLVFIEHGLENPLSIHALTLNPTPMIWMQHRSASLSSYAGNYACSRMIDF
jgi:hypothetical protein